MGLSMPQSPHGEKVRVVFCIQKSCYDSTEERVALFGSTKSLGSWDPDRALEASFTGMNNWIIETSFPPHSTIDFRLFIKQNKKTDFIFDGFEVGDKAKVRILHLENRFIRRLSITNIPLKVDLVYDRAEVNITESRSTATRTGNPIKLRWTAPRKPALFQPRQLGWDFLEVDSLTHPKNFQRVDTAVVGGTVVTTIRESLAEQQRREITRNLLNLCRARAEDQDESAIEADARVNKTEDVGGILNVNETEADRNDECALVAFDKYGNLVDAKGDYKRVLDRLTRLPGFQLQHSKSVEGNVGRTLGNIGQTWMTEITARKNDTEIVNAKGRNVVPTRYQLLMFYSRHYCVPIGAVVGAIIVGATCVWKTYHQ